MLLVYEGSDISTLRNRLGISSVPSVRFQIFKLIYTYEETWTWTTTHAIQKFDPCELGTYP